MTALQNSRKLHQLQLEASYPASMQLSGKTHLCAAIIKPFRNVPKEDGSGWERRQDIVIHVRKDLVPTAPEEKTTVIVNMATYLIDEVGGVNDHDIAWVLRASLRTS